MRRTAWLTRAWNYDLVTLGKDLSAHLVFGTATAAAFALLARVEEDQ
jgi:hypothetical protein